MKGRVFIVSAAMAAASVAGADSADGRWTLDGFGGRLAGPSYSSQTVGAQGQPVGWSACGTKVNSAGFMHAEDAASPEAPAGLVASDGVNCGLVELTWNSAEEATVYAVFRNMSNNPAGADCVVSNLTDTSYQDCGAEPGQTNYYWVKAGNAVGWSGFSDSDSGHVFAPPAAPAGLVSAPGYTSFIASWDPVDGTIGYRLDVSTERYFLSGGEGRVYVADFEGDACSAKTNYATGSLTNNGIVWTLNDAVVGDASDDCRNGSRSVRIRSNETVNAGMVSMAQNTNTGLSAITLQYAIHGADEGSAGRVDYSTNGGSTWIGAGTFIASSTNLTLFSATNIHATGNIRVRVVKTSGDAASRMNVDDITLYPCDPLVPSYVAGYSNRYVAGTSQMVTGLNEATPYYFRVRAAGDGD